MGVISQITYFNQPDPIPTPDDSPHYLVLKLAGCGMFLALFTVYGYCCCKDKYCRKPEQQGEGEQNSDQI